MAHELVGSINIANILIKPPKVASPDKLKFKQEKYRTGGPRECRNDVIYDSNDYPSYWQTHLLIVTIIQ